MTFFEKSHLFEYFILNYTDCMKRKKISEHMTGNTFIDIHGNQYDISKAKLVEGQIYTAKNERTDKNQTFANNKKSKMHIKRKNLPSFDKDSYWLDPKVYTPENKKNFLIGKIFTALCCSFFLFGAIMFFIPDIKINNAYALLTYHCIAAILSFIGIIFLMLAELKIKTKDKVSKLQLRKEDRASIKKVGTLAGLCKTVFIFSVSLIIVISIFIYLSGWFVSALKVIRTLLK